MRSIFLSLLLAWSFNSLANGIGTRGGGDAVICKDEKNIETVELLDLFEGREKHKYSLELFPGRDFRDIFWDITHRFRPQGWSVYSSPTDDQFEKHIISFVDDLEELADEGPVDLPANCRLQQLAIWNYGNQALQVNRSLWKRLNDLSKAALWRHEFEWREEILLGTDQRYSTAIRKRVARYFSSSDSFPVPLTPPRDGTAIHCESYEPNWSKSMTSIRYSEFDIWTANDETIIQFSVFRGRIPYDRTHIRIPVNLQSIYLVGVFEIEDGDYAGTPILVGLDKGQITSMWVNRHPQTISCDSSSTYLAALSELKVSGPGSSHRQSEGSSKIDNSSKTSAKR